MVTAGRMRGTERTGFNWPRALQSMSWLSNRWIWVTNVGISSGVLNGTTNWMRGDEYPGVLPAGSFGCIQRYPRWGPITANTYPEADKWILLMLPINDGSVAAAAYGASVTNYCNLAHADGWKVVRHQFLSVDFLGRSGDDEGEECGGGSHVSQVRQVYRPGLGLPNPARQHHVCRRHPSHHARIATECRAHQCGDARSEAHALGPGSFVASPTTYTPTNTSAIAAWEDVVAIDGSIYKRPLYQ